MGPILNCLDDFAKELGVLYAQTGESQVNDIVLILLCAQTEEVYRKTGGLLWLTERLKKKSPEPTGKASRFSICHLSVGRES